MVSGRMLRIRPRRDKNARGVPELLLSSYSIPYAGSSHPFQLFLNPDIISEELEELETAGDTGKNTFTVGFRKGGKGKIGGDDGTFFSLDPFIDNKEQLGGDKGIGQFCSQVIDNEKITVENIILHIIFGTDSPEGVLRHHVKQLKGRVVNNRMGAFDQFSGDTVGEEGFPQTGPSIEKQVGKNAVKFVDEPETGRHCILHQFPGIFSGGRMNQVLRIIFIGKITEIFHSQDILHAVLRIKQIDRLLTEAMTYF